MWRKNCSNLFFFLNTNSIVKNNAGLATESKSHWHWNDKVTSYWPKMHHIWNFQAFFFSSKMPLFHMRSHFKWSHFCGWVKMRCSLQALERHRLWHEKSRGLDQLDVWGKESRPCVCLIGASLIGLFWTAGHDTSHEYCLWPKTNIPHALIAG